MADGFRLYTGIDSGASKASVPDQLDWLLYGVASSSLLGQDDWSGTVSLEDPDSVCKAPDERESEAQKGNELKNSDLSLKSHLTSLNDLEPDVFSDSDQFGLGVQAANFLDLSLSINGDSKFFGQTCDMADQLDFFAEQGDDDVWQRMLYLNDQPSARELDAQRTFFTQFTTGAKYALTGLALGEIAQNGPTSRYTNLALAVYAADMSTKAVDGGYDYAQSNALDGQCVMLAPEACDRQRKYVDGDLRGTITATLTSSMRMASDVTAGTVPILSNGLSVVSVFTDCVALYSTLTSVWPVFIEQMSKDPKDRRDVDMSRAIKVIGSSLPIATATVYRLFGVAGYDLISGANRLTPADVAKMIRNATLSGDKADYLGNKSVPDFIGKVCIVVMIALSLAIYGPGIVEAYENGEDDRMVSNILGLLSVLSTNIGIVMVRNMKKGKGGLWKEGSCLMVAGVMLSAYQVHMIESGGMGKYSIMYNKIAIATGPFFRKINHNRSNKHLPVLEKEGQLSLDAWRKMLILAGLDDKSHSASILDDPSIQVPLRAANIYGLSQNQSVDAEDLLKTIYAESALSVAGYARQFPDKEPNLWQEVLDGIGRGAMCASAQDVECGLDPDVTGPFLTDGSIGQIAYLVFLEQCGVLTEEYWGEKWNDPRIVAMRDRLNSNDAKLFRREIINYNSRSTPELLVYLRMHRKESWLENPEELPQFVDNMQQDLGMSGISASLDTMQKQWQVLEAYFANDSKNGDQLSHAETEQVLTEIFADMNKNLVSVRY